MIEIIQKELFVIENSDSYKTKSQNNNASYYLQKLDQSKNNLRKLIIIIHQTIRVDQQ
jgi:hypothetical protein